MDEREFVWKNKWVRSSSMRHRLPNFQPSPMDGLQAVFSQVGVSEAEVMVAEETGVSGERRGMGRTEDEVARTVYDGALALCVAAPEDEDQVLFLLVQKTYDRVCKCLPSFSLVRTGFVSAYGQGCIQQENALFGPAGQVAACRNISANVISYLFENILQGGWELNPIVDRETQSVSLSRSVVGVLTDDDYLHLVEWTEVERIEDKTPGRVDTFNVSPLIFRPHERCEFFKVFFVKLLLKAFLPGRFNLYIHPKESGVR